MVDRSPIAHSLQPVYAVGCDLKAPERNAWWLRDGEVGFYTSLDQHATLACKFRGRQAVGCASQSIGWGRCVAVGLPALLPVSIAQSGLP